MMLEIIAVTYKHGRKLDIFLNSLFEQTCQDWYCQLIHDGPDQETAERVEKILQANPEYYGRVLPYSTAERHNDFGHTLRELGLKVAWGDYVNFQNADNYLVPRFVELMLGKAEKDELDFVYCDQLHNYAFGVYQVMNSEPRMNFIDIANFIVKTELAQKIGFADRCFAADGLFVEKVMATNPKAGKVSSVLSVHN